MKYVRRNKQTGKEEWLKIADDKSDYTWTDDYDSADSFRNEEVAKKVCEDACVVFYFGTYDYILEQEED